jgi:tetratricopeptide (TPR) repeat protein
MELYRDFLTAVKPDLIVAHRRGRRGLRSRNEQAALNKATNADDEDQEQDEDDVDDTSSPNSGTKTRRSSVITAAGESESDLVEDDDLVFVLNELGQAFAAQGQYHTAEVYYHHALRISEKHSLSTDDALSATTLAGFASSPTQSADEIGGSTGDLDISSVAAAVESAPIPIPRANSDVASASPPLGRAASWLPSSLVAAPGLNTSFGSTEHECKRWRGNLATTLHNLGKLYGEQCRCGSTTTALCSWSFWCRHGQN